HATPRPPLARRRTPVGTGRAHHPRGPTPRPARPLGHAHLRRARLDRPRRRPSLPRRRRADLGRPRHRRRARRGERADGLRSPGPLTATVARRPRHGERTRPCVRVDLRSGLFAQGGAGSGGAPADRAVYERSFRVGLAAGPDPVAGISLPVALRARIGLEAARSEPRGSREETAWSPPRRPPPRTTPR